MDEHEHEHEPESSLPTWLDRSRYRWINGLGFAISFALALIGVIGLLTTFMPGAGGLEFSFPAVYAVVAFVAMLVTIAIFAVLMFRFAWRGERFDSRAGRLYIFFWSLSGLLFFLCLTLIWIRFSAPDLPNLAPWATDFLWFLCPFGVVTFGLMSWTNSDLPHAEDYDDFDDHLEEAHVE